MNQGKFSPGYQWHSYPSGYGGGLEIHCVMHAQVRILPDALYFFQLALQQLRLNSPCPLRNGRSYNQKWCCFVAVCCRSGKQSCSAQPGPPEAKVACTSLAWTRGKRRTTIGIDCF